MQIRVGINSGDVVVRSIGSDLRMDYTDVGQTTHLAARMEQLAAPGSIRLTAGSLRLAEGLVQVAHNFAPFKARTRRCLQVSCSVTPTSTLSASAILRKRALTSTQARGGRKFDGTPLVMQTSR